MTTSPESPSHTKSQQDFDAGFEALLASWNVHQQLKASQGAIGDLWKSNAHLASQRFRVAQLVRR